MMRKLLSLLALVALASTSVTGQTTSGDSRLASALGTGAQPVFNLNLLTNPSSTVGTTAYGWLQADPTDSASDQIVHQGLAILTGASTSFINVSTAIGANSAGIVLPTLGGAGSGSGVSQGWSFEFVFKAGSVSNWAKLVNFGDGPGTNDWTLGWDGDDFGKILIETYNTGTPNYPHTKVEAQKPILPGKWYHIVVTNQAITGTLTSGSSTFGAANWYVYVNGLLQNWASALNGNLPVTVTSTQGANYPQTVPRPFSYIGKSDWSDPLLNVTVDAVRVYDYVLSATQVSALAGLYNLNTGTAPPTTANNYNFPATTERSSWSSVAGVPLPVFNGVFSEDPRPLVTSVAAAQYQWAAFDPSDNDANRNLHKGLIVLTGTTSSYIDLNMATGPNSVGLIMPIVGGSGSGSTAATRGFTFECVTKLTSVFAWAKLLELGSGAYIDSLHMGWYNGNNVYNALEVSNTNWVRTNLYGSTVSNPVDLVFLNTPPLRQWLHIAYTFSNADTTAWTADLSIYVNGVLTANMTSVSYPLPIYRQNSYVGASDWNDPTATALFDAIRVYDMALSATQIQGLATQYGLYGSTIPPQSSNTTNAAFAPTTESQAVAAAVSRAPIFNGYFGTDPTVATGSNLIGGLAYTWLASDPRDDAATQAKHQGLIQLSGSSSSYIDVTTTSGPNSVGLYLPNIGGAGSGTGATQGFTFETVLKFESITTWSKLIDFGTGPNFDDFTVSWDGDDNGRIIVQQYNNASLAPNFVKSTLEILKPTLGQWYHIVIGMKPATLTPSDPSYGAGTWYIYINGQLQNLADPITAGTSFTTLQGASYPLNVARPYSYIGKSDWNDPNMVTTVDAIRVYDYLLSQTEVTALATYYNLNNASMVLATPSQNVVFPSTPESTKHRTSQINFDPFFKIDFATDPTSYVGNSLNYQWLSADTTDSTADQAAHTGLAKFTGAAGSFVNLMTASGPNSAGVVLPANTFGASAGTGDAYGWTIEMVMKPTAIQTWSKFFDLGTGSYLDSIYIGWVGSDNTWEAGNYNNIQSRLSPFNPGHQTFYRGPTLNKWHHLAWVIQPLTSGTAPSATNFPNGFGAVWTLYINGQQVFSNSTLCNYPLPVYRQTSYLAASDWQADANAAVVFDAFRIWDRALTAAQVTSLATAYGITSQEGGDAAYAAALGSSRAPRYNLDFAANPTQSGGGATNWLWSEQDPTDNAPTAGFHTGLAILNGGANSYIDLTLATGANRAPAVMPLVGGATSPGAGYTAGWSFEVIFKATGVNNWAKLFNLGNGPYLDDVVFGFDGDDNGKLAVENYNNATLNPIFTHGGQVEIVKPTIIGKWYHVIWTIAPVDSSAGSANWQIFINGQLQNWANGITASTTLTALQGANFPLAVARPFSYLGKSDWNDPTMMVVYDAFRIYDYVLPQSLVTSLATAYGCNEVVKVYGPSDNYNYPTTTETTNYQSAGISTAPVFNGVFGQNPSVAVGSPMNYQWLQSDPNDSAAVQAKHQGLIVLNGSANSYIDLTTSVGPNSVGLVLPVVGGAGSGSGAARGMTIEIVAKVTSIDTWSKLVELSSGPNLDSFVIGWNSNSGNLEVHNFNEIKAPLLHIGSVTFTTPQINTWYHIAVVMQFVDTNTWAGNWTIYVNGNVAATLNAPLANYPLPIFRQNSYLGKSAWADANAHMIVDEFRVYDFALNQNQVQGMATQYGLYTVTNTSYNFPPTTESTSAATALGNGARAPVFNAWFGTDPSTAVGASTLNFQWLSVDPSDSTADQAKHQGLVKFSGATTSYVDVTTNAGPNSCGVVLPMIGGAGSGTGSSQGWTFEVVFKMTGGLGSWAKIFDFGNGPAVNNVILGWDGWDAGKLSFQQYNLATDPYPYGFTEVVKLQLNTWYHVVVMLQPVDMTRGSANWIFYVNGQLYNYAEQITSGKSFTPIQGASYPKLTSRPYSYLGKSDWSDPTLQGVIDAMRVYDYVLSSSQITALANQYGCLTPSMALPTAALNNANVNPSSQTEVNAWNIAGLGIPQPVFNAPFPVSPITAGVSSSLNYQWMASDPTDSLADQARHKGLISINGSAASFIDLNQATGPNSVGLILPTLFGSSSGSGARQGWSVEVSFKSTSVFSWAKFLEFGSGTNMDSFVIGWYGNDYNSWEVQNYNNINPNDPTNPPNANTMVQQANLEFWKNPPLNQWVHVVIAMVPTTNYAAQWTVYVNGALNVSSSIGLNYPFAVTRHSAYIGASDWQADPTATAVFDAIRIYDQALSATQVQALAGLYQPIVSSTGVVQPSAVPQASSSSSTGSNNPPNPSSSSGGVTPGGDSSSSSSLSGGAIAGIVIGSIAGAILICVLLFCFLMSSRKGSKGNGSKELEQYGNRVGGGYGQMEQSTNSNLHQHTSEPEEVELANVAHDGEQETA